jgi:D-3-phosphoglycerate dehydrogenase
MIGRVGTIFGEHGVNIGSAAVGHSPANGDASDAVMVFTTDVPVPQELVDGIIASSEDFIDGRTVALG